jgi:hypothetical protein
MRQWLRQFKKGNPLAKGLQIRWVAFLIVFANSSIRRCEGAEASDFLVFSKGPVSIRPQLTISSEFNDNILFRERNVQGDFIQTFSPGVRFVAGEPLPDRNHVTFGYRLDEILYAEQTDLNAMQHRLGLEGRFGTERTQIAGADRLEFLSGPLGEGISLLTRQVDRVVWGDAYRLDYRISLRTGVYGSFFHDSTDFEEKVSLYDTVTLQGTLGFRWFLSEETDIFGELYYGETDLSPNFNTKEAPGRSFIGGFVGGRGRFTERLSGVAKAGLEYDEFEKIGTEIAAAPSKVSPVVEIALTYQYTDRSAASLSYLRQRRISIQFVEAPYIVDEIRAGANTILGSGHLTTGVNGRVALYQYEPSSLFASRNDTLLGANAYASWHFRPWISTRLQYDFSHFVSDVPSISSYDQNRISLSLEVGY